MDSNPLKPVYFPFTCSCPQAAANRHSSDILFGARVLPRWSQPYKFDEMAFGNGFCICASFAQFIHSCKRANKSDKNNNKIQDINWGRMWAQIPSLILSCDASTLSMKMILNMSTILEMFQISISTIFDIISVAWASSGAIKTGGGLIYYVEETALDLIRHIRQEKRRKRRVFVTCKLEEINCWN